MSCAGEYEPVVKTVIEAKDMTNDHYKLVVQVDEYGQFILWISGGGRSEFVKLDPFTAQMVATAIDGVTTA